MYTRDDSSSLFQLSVSEDDRKSGWATSVDWKRKGEGLSFRFSLPDPLVARPLLTDREPGSGYDFSNLEIHVQLFCYFYCL